MAEDNPIQRHLFPPPQSDPEPTGPKPEECSWSGCHEPRAPGVKMCQYHRNHHVRRRERWEKTGQCVKCDEQSLPGRQMCEKHQGMMNARSRRKYHGHVANGKCFSCGQTALTGRTYCGGCRENVRSGGQKLRRKRAAAGLCILCGMPLPDGTKIKNCPPCGEKFRLTQQAVKKQVMEAYGGCACTCCGENRIEFLTLDHLNNDGKQHRESARGVRSSRVGGGYGMYLWLRRHGYPKDPPLAVRCWNCNTGRSKNGGICPHERERQEAKARREEVHDYVI